MQSLESYLATEYFDDQQDMVELARYLAAVGTTFARLQQELGWQYEVPSDEALKMSPGTVAMVTTSLGRMLGVVSLAGGARRSIVEDNKVTKAFEHGLALLAGACKEGKVVQHAATELTSGTFGPNNPLTLSHVVELMSGLDRGAREKQVAGITRLVEAAKTCLKDLLSDKTALGNELLLNSKDGRYYLNAFVPLRALYAAKKLAVPFNPGPNRIFFESRLHDQLSFSAIPDSRFDPAELVFCLEGLLLCAPHAVDATLFKRVVEVLAEKQNTSAHWRPNKPFIGWRTGAILLPLSVEAANSLMRSVVQMDGRRYHSTHTAEVLPLMRRFWRWLLARAVSIEVDGETLLGWHSEHVNQPDVIHPWDTSQVAEFMLAYANLLDRHVAAQTLRLSRLSVKDPSSMGSLNTRPEVAKDRWAELEKTYDPSPNSSHQIYSAIGHHFVDGWAKGAPTSFSMLLYGPPGTGKTTVADALSDALGMRLITVTVSDFLGAGGENVETRAKAIFQTLEAQRDAVILFDEIDSFLLDRDSKFYKDQDSLFQFLTPGMLTKLADLRKRKRSIFIIATNYENRIDAAIKRTGRIDRHYLLPLPNAAKRTAILKKLGLEIGAERVQLITASVLKGFGDLKAAVEAATPLGGLPKPDEVVNQLKKAKPATSIASYAARFLSENPYPEDELAGLVALLHETGDKDEITKQLASVTLKMKKEMPKIFAEPQTRVERRERRHRKGEKG